MFYIDKVLFANRDSLPETTTMEFIDPTTEISFTTSFEVEKVPPEVGEENGAMPDVLFADAEAVASATDIPSEIMKTTTARNETKL